ncbi:MAG: PAS domain-containing protein [Chloroflexi bacterium]|nr:PAS domain-containing protein [Chloroflexota bacterium]
MFPIVALPLWRSLVVAAAAIIVWRLPWSVAERTWQSTTPDDPARLAFGVLGLATCVVSVLTLHFPGRRNVSLLLLPVLLVWWQLDGALAVGLAGFGALFGNAMRRAAPASSVAGAARVVLAATIGMAIATQLDEGQIAGPADGGPAAAFSPAWLAAAFAFITAASVADMLLDWLEARFGVRAERIGRLDLVTNVLILPLAFFLDIVGTALGIERLAVFLVGLLALLFVIRASINLRTLHASLQRLHRTVAGEREKLSTLIAHSGEGIFTVDGERRMTSVNPAMADLLGLPSTVLEGQPCAIACHFEDAEGQRLCPHRCPLRRAQVEQRPIAQDVVYRAPEQPPKHLLLTYAAVGEPDGSLSLGIGIARDVTAQKETEQLRQEFVSLVIHELRSPLTASLGYLSLLKRLAQRSEAPEGDKQLRYVERVEGAERHLLRLVNNLLDLARVERPEFAAENSEVALGPLIQEVVDTATMMAARKQIGIHLEAPEHLPTLWTSDFCVREALSNLVSNAVKYTPDGGTVTVRVSGPAPVAPVPERHAATTREAGGTPASPVTPGQAAPVVQHWVEIAVVDTGIGMSPEEQSRLFTKFFRSGRPEVRQERGTGLGLVLTKQLMEKLGGTISVRSAIGEGSAFTVTLPVVEPPPPTESEDGPEAAADGAAPVVRRAAQPVEDGRRVAAPGR